MATDYIPLQWGPAVNGGIWTITDQGTFLPATLLQGGPAVSAGIGTIGLVGIPITVGLQ